MTTIKLTVFDQSRDDPGTWIHGYIRELNTQAQGQMAMYYPDGTGILNGPECRTKKPLVIFKARETLNLDAAGNHRSLRSNTASDSASAATTPAASQTDLTHTHEYKKVSQHAVVLLAFYTAVVGAANVLLDPLSDVHTGLSEYTLQQLSDYLIKKYATMSTQEAYRLTNQHATTKIPADPRLFERMYMVPQQQIANLLAHGDAGLTEHAQLKVLTDQLHTAHPSLLKGLQRYREALAAANAVPNAATKKETYKDATESIVAYIATIQLDTVPASAHHATAKDVTALTALVAQLQAQLKTQQTQQKTPRGPDERALQYCFKCGHQRTHASADCGIMRRSSEYTPAMKAAKEPCTIDGRAGSTNKR